MSQAQLDHLDARDERLVRLVLATMTGRWKALADLRRKAPAGEPDRGWREALLQTHLFAGFPRVVEAFTVLERAGGLGTLEEHEGEQRGESTNDGRALFARIYGERAEGVSQRLRGFHPVLAEWLEAHAYGRTLNRPGLEVTRREVLAVACLTALGQKRQLIAHVRGALAVGVATPALQQCARVAADWLPGASVAVLNEVLAQEG